MGYRALAPLAGHGNARTSHPWIRDLLQYVAGSDLLIFELSPTPVNLGLMSQEAHHKVKSIDGALPEWEADLFFEENTGHYMALQAATDALKDCGSLGSSTAVISGRGTDVDRALNWEGLRSGARA